MDIQHETYLKLQSLTVGISRKNRTRQVKRQEFVSARWRELISDTSNRDESASVFTTLRTQILYQKLSIDIYD
jgi:hypothetical protein